MNNIIIREMTIQDLELISPTLQVEYDDFWNISTFKGELNNENSYYIVALSDDEIVGFGGFMQLYDEIHISNIVTKKNKRNFGIGTKILDKLLEIAETKNCITITLEVNEQNLPAISLYEKFGFKKVGFRKNYYHGNESAIIMTK